MDRRDFLKVFGGVVLIPLVPSTAFADAPTDLQAWFENNFTCKKADFLGQSLEVGGRKYIYYTFAVGVLNGSDEDAKKRISQYFIDQFAPFAKDKPELWWRVEPYFESDEVTTFGKTWMTAEEIEDGGVRDGKFYKASGGVKIGKKYTPLKWEEVKKPEGVELDFETNSFKYVKSVDTLHKMRFRLVIPAHLQKLETFAHIEGRTPRKI